MLDKLPAQQITAGILCTIHDLKMTSGDPGLAMPSKMFSSEGGVLHLGMHVEMCIPIAALRQRDGNLFIGDQAWTRQLERKVNRHCTKEIRCNSFFLRHK